MKLLFGNNPKKLTSPPSAGGVPVFSTEGSVSYDAPTTTGYLTYSKKTVTGVSSLVFGSGVEIVNNLTPLLCTVAEPNKLTGMPSGAAISVVVREDGREKFFFYTNVSGTSTYDVTQSCASGSLPKHLEDQVLAKLSGKLPGDSSQAAWASYSATPEGFVSATPQAGIVDGLNIAATSVWRSGRSDDAFPLMLVTNRHAVTVGHVIPAVGAKITYRRPDGSTQTVTVDAVYRYADRDFCAVHFDAAITGITPYSLVAASGLKKFNRSSTIIERVLCVVKALHRPNGTWKSYWGVAFARFLDEKFVLLSTGKQTEYHEQADVSAFGCSTGIGGDSGSPMFFVIGGAFVLSGVWNSPGGTMTSLIGIESSLNTVLNSLATSVSDPAAGTYAVTTVDLSAFTDYS